jgi:hypothetical protein
MSALGVSPKQQLLQGAVGATRPHQQQQQLGQQPSLLLGDAAEVYVEALMGPLPGRTGEAVVGDWDCLRSMVEVRQEGQRKWGWGWWLGQSSGFAGTMSGCDCKFDHLWEGEGMTACVVYDVIFWECRMARCQYCQHAQVVKPAPHCTMHTGAGE